MPTEGLLKRILLKPRSFLFLLLLLIVPTVSQAQVAVGVSIRIGPSALPVYAQPPCPGDGYLWTPGYWGFEGGFYGWHVGYWGPHVGFYGGINYGFGYGGVGFFGGRWVGERFAYNTAVVNVNTTIVHNAYVDRTVINNNTIINNNHYSFNGQGGATARPNAPEQAAMHENHVQPTSNQLSHEQAAGQDHNQLASVNNGRPGTMAMDSVNGRRYNQQGRIANGIRSGQMSPSEAAKTEWREQNINRQQNGASRRIYNEKHNEKTAPK